MAQAMYFVANDLTQQVGGVGRVIASAVVVDSLIDARTGQQTGATRLAEQHLASALAFALRGAAIIPLNSQGAATARYVVSGTLGAADEQGRYQANVALSDRQTGMVIGQVSAPFRQAALDHAPTRFYSDSPSLVRDKAIDGHVRTSTTSAGRPADALYIEQLPTSALLADALRAYNEGRWADALAQYQVVAQRPDGQLLRTYNGMYLCYVQLGRLDDAEAAFGKIVELGLTTNNLAIKLLFRPASVEFWPDPRVSSLYPMWLRQIAQAAQASTSCLRIVGHTSRSGSATFNDQLSMSRATVIRDLLDQNAPTVATKLQVNGVGSRENVVGTGADDATDAIDRRVEFRVIGCSS